ncbi:MAG: NUDIX hydrolase [Devosia sp.]
MSTTNTPTAIVDTPLRSAATVMLLRDGLAGMEVLLLKRHMRSDVHGGVHVFPGGKVDEADGEAARQRFGDGMALQPAFGDAGITPAHGATLYIAALRELAEECAVVIEDVAAMHPHSRWITPQPSTSPKRFDTWFFLALLPVGAIPQHDNHEAVESVWLRPRDALRRYWDGSIQLAPPQIMSLAALARHDTAQDALMAAHAARPPCVQPEHIGEGEERLLAFPGDPAHSVAQAAIPGPTRLIWRAQRYEPLVGFDGFFT